MTSPLIFKNQISIQSILKKSNVYLNSVYIILPSHSIHPNNIAFTHALEIPDQGNKLKMRGDFSALPEGQNYSQASLEIAEMASAKIKMPAESILSRVELYFFLNTSHYT